MRREEETGICRECGCTWTTPCVDQKFGSCWWMDETQSLCSHCYYDWNCDIELSLLTLSGEK